MPIEFDCHVCGRLLRTSEDKAGRTAKCPGCGEAVAVPVPVEEQAEEPVAEETDDNVAAEDATAEENGINGTDDTRSAHDHSAAENAPLAISRRTRGSKICPVCGETIKAVAIRCRYCGEDVAEVEQLPQTLEFGEVFSASWKLFSDDLGLHIGAMFIVGLISLVVVGVGVFFWTGRNRSCH
jgi:DNA-directed RNA polymerase subunit M/transcription elongation factor TFIIS